MFTKTEHRTSSSKFIAVLTLVALLAIVLFGFATMSYGSDGKMEGNCPFSVMGAPSCPQDLAAAALHHISSYQSLLNATQVPGVALIIALLLLVYGVFIFFIRPPAFQPQLIGYLRRSPHSSARDRETTRWLSLFEHSPSLQ